MNGFLDPGLLGFVFTPVLLTLALLVCTSSSRAKLVALPPLALPVLYFAAVIAETLLKQGGMSLSESHPGLVRAMMLFSASFVLAGLLLGIIGWLRRERLRWLPVMGMLMCPGIVSYVAVGLHVMGGD